VADLERVNAYVVWAIFADYDGMAPDTKDLVLCASEEIARETCEWLNERPEEFGNLAFVEGFEHAKYFAFHERLVRSPLNVNQSVEDAKTFVKLY